MCYSKVVNVLGYSLHSYNLLQHINNIRLVTRRHASFISNIFISNARSKLAKNQAKAKQHSEAELLLLKNYVLSSSILSSKDNRRYFEKYVKDKNVYLNEVIWLMTMKMMLIIKNRSGRYDIHRPRCRHEHKYTKYIMDLSMMMVIHITQHLSKIWSSIQEKVKQTQGWVRKSVSYKKAFTSSLTKFSVFLFLITTVFFEINTSVEVCHNFRNNFTQKGFILW